MVNEQKFTAVGFSNETKGTPSLTSPLKGRFALWSSNPFTWEEETRDWREAGTDVILTNEQ